jgi:dihydroorotate dehydrogenase
MRYALIRKILFSLDPEQAHHLVLKGLKYWGQSPLLGSMKAKPLAKPVKVFDLEFPNPVGLAAGFDNNADSIDGLFGLGFGFVEVGGVTPKPQHGNPKPRLFRIPEANALINRMGFDNKGVDYAVERLKNRKISGIVGINIGKNKDTPLEKAVEDYQYCLTRAYPYVDYVTINISSPNTPGLRDLQSESYLESFMRDLKSTHTELSRKYHRNLPLLVKLSVDLTDQQLESTVRTLMRYEIQGIIAANTSTDHKAVSDYRFGNEVGGLSGKPIFQRSTEMLGLIRQMTQAKLPVIGLGGILTAEDAQEKLNAGASLVQIYTGLIYRGPNLIQEIIKELK